MISVAYMLQGLGLQSNPLEFITFLGKARLSLLSFQCGISMISVWYRFSGLGLHCDPIEFSRFPGKARMSLLSSKTRHFNDFCRA